MRQRGKEVEILDLNLQRWIASLKFYGAGRGLAQRGIWAKFNRLRKYQS